VKREERREKREEKIVSRRAAQPVATAEPEKRNLK
jgi:hypothetical protein